MSMGNEMEKGKAKAEKPQKSSRWFSATKRFRKDRRGVAAIEMAIVTWPFFAVMFAILEQGVVFFAEFVLEHNVAEAARQIRTGQVTSTDVSASQFKAMVCPGSTPGIELIYTCSNLNVDVRTFAQFADIATGLPAPVDNNNELNPLNNFATGGELSVMVVRAFYEWNTLTPAVFTRMDNLGNGNRLIAATTTFRNEPFGE
ncbi:MAG: TadE/TadG family type IV pilus assembly protein [Pseudomonadota bacterium]